MSRYIDADALKEWLDEYLSVFKKYDKSEVKGFVEHRPSIDIVRCKECKCARNIENEWICEHLSGMAGLNVLVNDDDFCSYGERSEP